MGSRAVVVLAGPDEGDPPGLDELVEGTEVRVVRTASELAAALPGAEVLAVYDFRTPLLHELGAPVGELAWIHAASAGVDAVLTPAVLDADTLVTNARGVFDRAIAEYVLALLLVFTKDLHTTLALQRRHEWRHRETGSLAGRRLLVVGAGSIGRAVGRLAGAAGMRVTGVARSARVDDPDFESVTAADSLLDALPHADDVVVCAPLTPATRGLFGAAAFGAMKPGACFVNVGRGAIVDESALLDALAAGRVSAAGLDVFVDEPLPEDHPFWDLPNVVVSPHMSGDEVGWERALTRQFGANLERWVRGEPLEHVIDKSAAGATAA